MNYTNAIVLYFVFNDFIWNFFAFSVAPIYTTLLLFHFLFFKLLLPIHIIWNTTVNLVPPIHKNEKVIQIYNKLNLFCSFQSWRWCFVLT